MVNEVRDFGSNVKEVLRKRWLGGLLYEYEHIEYFPLTEDKKK
jgi:hypothetical protein